ncbi:UDP-N-acetylmuramoyl-L-alanine--D-glutamate ligase, partial [Streptomyces sp. NPDC000931]|uniref:UDP-N-acetylmuramoyl-L-alanine--D-glutamate ligase n=1 Tax=Streptomyces sp. NPDC000931 TaxID=3154372 RepID=UPI00331D7D61
DDTTRPVAAALTEAGAEVVLGDTPLPEGCDLVVTSPGWRPDSPLLVRAAEAGVEVIGDVELAWRLKPADQVWLAITGTNGKTTTVRMLESILRADGRDALAVGNVGTPIVDAVLPDADGHVHDVLAVELSSFQLHWSNSVRPHAATVLNVAPDHLDWHGGLQPYARAKGKVFARGTIRVVNTADAWSVRLAEEEGDPHTPVVGLRLDTPGAGEFGVVEDLLVDRAFVDEPHSSAEELATLADVRPAAPHNVANALAAAALARSLGVAPASVRAGLTAFVPEPHRIAYVASVAGVDYVDDSKATNPHAAAASPAGRGRNLAAEGICVLPMGGAMNIGRFARLLGPPGLGLRLTGLCDEGERGYYARGLERAGVARQEFFVCAADLEDELIRALGVTRVEELVRAEGDLRPLRTFLSQPAQRDRAPQQRLRRFLGTKKGRKIHYGRVLVEALHPERVPAPLDGLLTGL